MNNKTSKQAYYLNIFVLHQWFCAIIAPLGKVMRPIRSCFKKADFRSPFVKILVNTKVLTAFCASVDQKSALCKIFDLTGCRFCGIFARDGCRNTLCIPKMFRVKRTEICSHKAASDGSHHLLKTPPDSEEPGGAFLG